MRTIVLTLAGMALYGSVLAAQGNGDAAKGKTAYAARNCATCHMTNKNDAKGGKMATILADTVGKLSPADIRTWLTDPAKMEATLSKKPAVPMSVFIKNLKPALSDAEVANLTAYVRTLAAN